jgi:hypothetical protein
MTVSWLRKCRHRTERLPVHESADKQRTVRDGSCGGCQACEEDFFLQQICDEVEGTFKDMIVQ